MSLAGREIGLSPAVVSKRISLLEERLNTRLFQRTTRQLTLTETGQGYYQRVVDILALVEESEDFVSRRNTLPRGILKISVPNAVARMFLLPCLADFQKQYPEIELNVHVSDNFVDIIREGYDLAIRIGELKDSSLVARKLATEHRVLCATPGYLKDAGTPKKIEDLEGHVCLIAGAHEVWRFNGPAGKSELRIRSALRSNSGEFIREALLQGIGISMLASWDIGPEIESGQLQTLMPEYTRDTEAGIYAVYPCREFMPAKVNSFIEFFSSIVEKGVANAPELAESGVDGREKK